MRRPRQEPGQAGMGEVASGQWREKTLEKIGKERFLTFVRNDGERKRVSARGAMYCAPTNERSPQKASAGKRDFSRSFEMTGSGKLLGRAEGEEVLGAFDGLLEAAEKLLEVVAALDEIDVRGIDDQEVGGGVAEEEVFVGAGDFLDVHRRDQGFVAGSFFGDARAEDFGLGLEINDQVGSGDVRGEGFVIALVKLELFVVEIEIGEDAVLFHEEVGEGRTGGFDGKGFAETFLALDEEVHLRAESCAGLFLVEIGEEGIVLAIVDAAGMKAFGEDARQGSFADA